MAAESVIGGCFIGSVCESVKAVSLQDCDILVTRDKLVLYRRREGPKIEKTEISEENATENALEQPMFVIKELTKGELDAMAERYAREYPHAHRTESWQTSFRSKELG